MAIKTKLTGLLCAGALGGLLYFGYTHLINPAGNIRSDLESLEQKISQEPAAFESVIDEMLSFSYHMKLIANKGHKVRQSCANPVDIFFRYNTSSRGDFLSVVNRRTGEVLPVYDVYGTTQLGSCDHRIEGLKLEVRAKMYNQTRYLGRKVEKVGENAGNVLMLLGEMINGSN